MGQVLYACRMHDYKIDSARVSVPTSVAVVFAAGFAVLPYLGRSKNKLHND